MKLFLLVFILPLAGAINCDVDEDLSDATEYSYTLPVSPRNMTYWKTYHLNFEVYGSFSEDEVDHATVTAGYYTKDGSLVYGVSIDCYTSTWTSTVSDEVLGTSKPWQTGSVTCEAGNWDLWLKVQQPFLMNWIFKGEALQAKVTEYHQVGWGRWTWYKERPAKVPTKFGAHKARTYKVETSAALSRFTFGECVSYPNELGCRDSQEWYIDRSKWIGSLSHFGANEVTWKVQCTDSGNFQHIQRSLHPDRLSMTVSKYSIYGSPYCCCVDMATGHVYNDDRENYCMQLSGNFDECLEQCRVTFDSSMYAGTEWIYQTFENYYGMEISE